MKLIGDWLEVEREKHSEKTEGGLYLPTESIEMPNTYKVINAGEGQRDADMNLIPMQAKIGDVIVAETYSEKQMKVRGKTMTFMLDRNVIAIL